MLKHTCIYDCMYSNPKKKCINNKPACIYDQFNNEPAAAFGPSSLAAHRVRRGAGAPPPPIVGDGYANYESKG
jgi:hypothetical protein